MHLFSRRSSTETTWAGLGLDPTGIRNRKRVFHRLMTSRKTLWLVVEWWAENHSPGDRKGIWHTRGVIIWYLKWHIHVKVKERHFSSVLKKSSHFSCCRVPVNQHFLISICLFKFLCSEHPAVGKSQVYLQPSRGDRAIQRPLSGSGGKRRTRLHV